MRDVRVHHYREIRHGYAVAEISDRIEERNTDALLEHSAGEVVGNFEVQGSGHDPFGLDEAEKALELRGDAVIRPQAGEYRLPDIADFFGAVGHTCPYEIIEVTHRVIHRLCQ